MSAQAKHTPRFANVSCSQCGRDFGPGDHGYSHCSDHSPRAPQSPRDSMTEREQIMFDALNLVDQADGLAESASDYVAKMTIAVRAARAAIAKATGAQP